MYDLRAPLAAPFVIQSYLDVGRSMLDVGRSFVELVSRAKMLLEVKNLKTHFHTADGLARAVDGVSGITADLHGEDFLAKVCQLAVPWRGRRRPAHALWDLYHGRVCGGLAGLPCQAANIPMARR